MKLTLAAFVLALCISSALSARVIGYWGCNPGGHMSTAAQLKTAINKGYNTIIYAFYDVDANGGLYQDPGAVTPPVKSTISSNFTYLVSLFGGENGAAPSLTLTPDAWGQAMFNNFGSLRNKYGFDGIDIDLENAWGGTPNKVICGLRKFFQLMHNAKYIVSMAPQTTALTPEVPSYSPGSWNSYAPLADTSIIDYVDIVAVQLYNNAVPANSVTSYANSLINGFQVSGSPGDCSIKATGLVKVPAKKIAFGYPAGTGAAPSGCPGLPGGCPYGSAMTNLYNSNAVLSGSGGVMTWSVEWDEASNWQFVGAAAKISWQGGSSGTVGSATVASATVGTATTATAGSATTGTSGTVTSGTGSSSGTTSCTGKSDGMYCSDSTHFMWCPQQIIQACAPGTKCLQAGNSISCA